MRIAYLVNRYPAASHSFIRREIAGIEALGAEVLRHSVRPAGDDLVDPADRAERDATYTLLAHKRALAGAVFAEAMGNPARLFRAARVAAGMARTAGSGRLRHVAYLVEACLLARRMRKAGVRHLHAHFGTNPAAVARLAGRLSGIPYSFTAHGPDEFDRPEGLDLGGKIADAAFCAGVSSFGRSQLMRWSGLEHWSRIHVVRCGVDASFARTETVGLGEAGALVCVARLSGQKGLPLLIEAAALLKTRRDFTLRILGDGELRPTIEARIARLGLERQVILAGWADEAKVRAELLRARVLVLGSFAEGLPVVLMEALALGRPVIATAIAGIPELVDDGVGWLVPAGSAEALADAMEAALDTPPAQLAVLGAEGRRRVRARHDARAEAARLLRHIEATGAR